MVAAVAVVVFFPSSFFNMVYSFYVIFFSSLEGSFCNGFGVLIVVKRKEFTV